MSRAVSVLLDLVFLRRCVLCHRLLERDEPQLCPACAAALPEPISGARRGSFYKRWTGALWYEDTVRESFHRYKFGGCRFYARYYGPLLAKAVEKQLGDGYDILTYIPINALRKRQRGYDQTLLLAREAGKLLGMEPVSTLKSGGVGPSPGCWGRRSGCGTSAAPSRSPPPRQCGDGGYC